MDGSNWLQQTFLVAEQHKSDAIVRVVRAEGGGKGELRGEGPERAPLLEEEDGLGGGERRKSE